MPEGKKQMRLNKVAKEFNIGISTIVDFLKKKGKEVESNPNAKVDDEMYELLVSEFAGERLKKDKADKLQISLGKKAEKEDIVAEDGHKEEQNSPANSVGIDAADIMVKTTTIDFKNVKEKKSSAKESSKENSSKHKKSSTKSNSKALDYDNKVADNSSNLTQKSGETLQEEGKSKSDKPIIDNTTKTPIIDNDKSEVIKLKEGQLNILGTIDLDSLNTKTKPDKHPKDKKDIKYNKDKKKDNSDKKTVDANKSGSDKPSKKDKIKQEKSQKLVDSQHKTDKRSGEHKPQKSTIVEDSNQPKVHKEDTGSGSGETEFRNGKSSQSQEGKKDNFIETNYVKLTGPILTGEKVDLSQFEHSSKSKDSKKGDNNSQKNGEGKKKRKRIKTATATPVNRDSENKDGFQNKDNKTKKDKKKDKRKRIIIDDNEIEKQIKETLARLSPLGKSKTSKHRREKRQDIAQRHEMELLEEEEQKKVLKVTEFVTANELATMMNVPVTKIIASCMQLGMFVSINQRLDAEALQLIADEFGFKIEFVSSEVVNTLDNEEEEDKDEDLLPRSPIVTVMGHVDHGKTSLLDYIRKTNVIAGEAGGITQHIGAYEVELSNGRKITFLDTPGHEAFTAMRARGAKITDIAIIVIACDDKIMPQTVEAINHAQAAGVPIIFALNKIDKEGADPERIKGELANMNLLVEDWGGKIQSQEISAKKGINVDLLLEKVLLEAEMLDLKGNPNKRARGTVIESSLDKGRGYIAKILVQDGTIHQGDFVLAGATFGRVKAMYNERNQIVNSAGPSTPVLLLGLNNAPGAGDTFNVVANEKEAKDLAGKRLRLQREQGLRTQKHITLDEIGRRIAIGDFKQLDLIIKADVDGSVEALADSLLKLSTPEVQVNVIHKSVGQITENDVLLATASNAVIIGFQVRPSQSARNLAEKEQIDIRLYSIIYDAINEIKDAIEGMLSPEIKEKVVCNLEVRETFKISKVGTIAGCFCTEGKINKSTKVRLIRDGIVVYTGNLASLKRFKDEVKEVVSGQDCGLNIENFNDVKVGDIIEGYDEIEVKRTLK